MTSSDLPKLTPKRERAVNTRSLDLEDQAWALRISGLTYRQIGLKLGMSEAHAYGLCKKHNQAVTKRMLDTTGPELLSQDLERIDSLFAASYAYATGGPVVDEHGDPVLDDNGSPKVREPDPRFLLRCSELLKQRADLLGLSKVRVEISGPNGGPVQVAAPMDLSGLTPAQVAQLEWLLNKAGMKAPTVIDGEIVDGVQAKQDGFRGALAGVAEDSDGSEPDEP